MKLLAISDQISPVIYGQLEEVSFWGIDMVISCGDLPLDYLETFNKNVNAVTLEKIKDAFKRRIDPGKMVTIIVGGAG